MNSTIQQLNKIAERFSSNENQDELAHDLEALLVALHESELMSANKPEGLSSLVKERSDFFFDISKPREEYFIPSGYKVFDRELSGWRKGELAVIAARPGMGKTQLMIDMAVRIAKQGVNCGILALEQNKTSVVNRIICNLSLLSQEKVMKGIFNSEEKDKIKDALNKMQQLPIWIVDQHIGSAILILERCKQLIAEQKTEVIFIDYIQLIGTIHRRNNRETELAIITRILKRLAVEQNVVIVILSQLSRAVETRASGSKRPMLSDLRESGAIEQDADKVMFLYRPEYYGLTEDENGNSTSRRAELIVSKNKIGTMLDIHLTVNQNFTAFKDYEEVANEIVISEVRLKEIGNSKESIDDPF
jgi:replicative DNA helicase